MPVTVDDQLVRAKATNADNFDPAELPHGHQSQQLPPFALAIAPILIVLVVNLLMSFLVLPRGHRLPRRTAIQYNAGRGKWCLVGCDGLGGRVAGAVPGSPEAFAGAAQTLDAGASASVLPALNTASLVGFGAVIAASGIRCRTRRLPGRAGRPLVSIAVAANVIGGITGSASGGLIIALNALGEIYAEMGAAAGIDPALMHRVASISSGALAMLPTTASGDPAGNMWRDAARQLSRDHDGRTHGPLLALAVVIILGRFFGAF